jgi:hypothetical protein
LAGAAWDVLYHDSSDDDEKNAKCSEIDSSKKQKPQKSWRPRPLRFRRIDSAMLAKHPPKHSSASKQQSEAGNLIKVFQGWR